MKKLLFLLGALYLPAATITDTLTNAVGGGAWTGKITIAIASPGSAQPLYAGTTSLAGWRSTYCVGVTGNDCTVTSAAGVFVATLTANDTITPGGTSYTVRYAPSKGDAWSEIWVVATGNTKIYQVRSTTVPTPTVTFALGQIAGGGAALGECLVYSGTAWEPGSCAEGAAAGVSSITGTANQITASAATGAITLSIPTSPTLPGTTTGTFSGNLTGNVTGNVSGTSGSTTGNAATATALTTNGTNCASGEYARGVDASGNAENCTTATGGGGTVSEVSVTTANGVSGSVANATTTPAITLTLGAITPTTVVASGNISGANLSGTNTGDQTTITGNAGTATALAANGANCSAGQFPLGVNASGAAETCTALPTTIAGTANQITASASTGAVVLSIPTNPTLPGTTTGTFSGNLTGNVTGNVSGSSGSTTGNAATATALATPRAINGTNFDGTAAITVTASLPSNPTACSAGAYVTDIAADGTLTCDTPAGGAHTQNTDSGTTQTSFQIDSGNTGPRIKNNAGTMEVRNAADGALAPLTASVITADSFTTSGSGAGAMEYTQGTAPSLGTNSIKEYAPTSVTAYGVVKAGSAATGFLLRTNAANIMTETMVGFSGTGDVVRATSPTLVTPALGTPSALVGTNISGTAAGLTAGAATALAANGTNCSSGEYAKGVDASGNAEGCTAVAGGVNRQITLVVVDPSTTGTKSCSVVEVAGTIVAAHLIANALPTGSDLVIDVLKVAYASYTGVGAASSITASATPIIDTGDTNPRYEDTTLTGWTTSVSANDVVCVSVTTAPSGGATWASLSLEVQ